MNPREQRYHGFASLLGYPHSTAAAVSATLPEFAVSKPLEIFLKVRQSLSVEELEELYTRTFDINPIVSLEVGWHLYGEQYERGEFLVRMRQLLHNHGIEESSELPDHLTHILLLLGKMETSEADSFAAQYVLPSLEKILEGFNDPENPYKNLLLALKQFVEREHLQGTEIHE